MKNIFSAEEPAREVDSCFRTQAQAQAGGVPVAPSCNPTLPAPPGVPLRTPDFENLAERSAPGHAASADLTYQWRR